jgi:hypothetical protein
VWELPRAKVLGKRRPALTRSRPAERARPGLRVAAASLLYLGLLQAPDLCAAADDTPDVSAAARPVMIKAEDDRVSARVQEAPLQDVLQAFSDATGIEIVISGPADETISVEFEDLPADEALRTILGERSSMGFYARDESASDDTPPRLSKAWIFKGVARSRATLPVRKNRRTPGSTPRADPFESLKRQALTDKSPDRRKRAINALVAADDEKAKSALVRALLNDRDAEVRQAALDNLLWYDDEAPRQPLIKAALRDSSPEVRRLAIEEGFAELAEDDPAARRVLIQGLSDKDASIRLIVVEALGNLASFEEEDKDVQRALVRALNDKDENVRLAAIEGLEETQRKTALTRAAKNDPSERVQQAAREALARLE